MKTSSLKERKRSRRYWCLRGANPATLKTIRHSTNEETTRGKNRGKKKHAINTEAPEGATRHIPKVRIVRRGLLTTRDSRTASCENISLESALSLLPLQFEALAASSFFSGPYLITIVRSCGKTRATCACIRTSTRCKGHVRGRERRTYGGNPYVAAPYC